MKYTNCFIDTSSTSDFAQNKHHMNRRSFLKASGLATITLGGMAFLTACGPAPEGTSGSAASSSASPKHTFGSEGKMRVGMEANYAPYNWQTDTPSDYTLPIENVSGAYADGYDVQFAKIIAEAMELEPVVCLLYTSDAADE